MFLFLVSTCAVVSCVILIVFLKLSTDKQHQQQYSDHLVDPINFLRAVKSTKPFPVNSRYGWKVFCFYNDTRIWKRNLIVDNSGTRIQILACFVKVSAPVQVVAKALKDVTRFIEWRPGFESSSHCQNGKQQGCVSHDFINIVTANQKLSIYSVVVEQKNIERYWRREDNGCFWLLESSDSGILFYILQPVEDLDKCCLTLVSHSVCPVTIHDSAVTMSCYAQSIRDYMLYRKMKVTPLLNIHIPQTKTAIYEKSSISLTDEKPLILSSATDDLTESSLLSSSDDENSTDQFHKNFAVLNPAEKSIVLEKSNFILHPQSKVRLRSQSDTNTGEEKLNNIVKQRSATLPKDITSSKPAPSQHISSDISQKVKINGRKVNICDLDQRFDDDVFIGNSKLLPENVNTQIDKNCLPKSDNTQYTVISSKLPVEDGAQNSLQNVPCDNNYQSVQHPLNNGKLVKDDQGDIVCTGSNQAIDEQSSNDEVDSGSFSANQKKEEVDSDKSSPENIRHITLANQCAADLLREFLQVCNLDLKKTTSQQSGSWGFCGLENDVVILKKTHSDGSSVVSYMGKGLINASPQTVMETVKNPRTKFTYDETLKKVDILNDITKNIKIVYFYHEVINVFKKNCYDFCVLQSERQDGDKYVLANMSVDSGLPNPAGVQRAQMLPSGWVIQPVQKEKKMYSMATYVIQVDFGMPTSNLDKTAIEELVSKQALGIAFLRQFLIPAKWKSRQQSSPVSRQQSSPVPKQQSSQVLSQQSSSVSRHQSTK